MFLVPFSKYSQYFNFHHYLISNHNMDGDT